MIRFSRVLPLVVLVAACHHGASPSGTGSGPMAAPAKPALPAGMTPQLIAQGDSIVHSTAARCQGCHAMGLVGGQNAPSLVAGPWLQSDGSFPALTAIVINGVPKEKIKDPAHTRAMTPKGGPLNLTDDQSKAVAAYVWSVSRAKTK